VTISKSVENEIPKAKFYASNLGEQLIKKGLSFKGYSEALPAIGSEMEIGLRPALTNAFMPASTFRGSVLKMFPMGRRLIVHQI
jgi:hypothetical protein